MIDKSCENCKNSNVNRFDVPCKQCIDGGCLEYWEQSETKKDCENCKHAELEPWEVPCTGCIDEGSLPKWEQAEQVEQDNVNHPKHYEGSTSLECIEVMELAFGKMAVCDFCICNAFKYLWRYKNKNGVEDLNKAHWYLRKAEKLAEYDVDKERIEKLLEVYNKHTTGELVKDVKDVKD